MVEHRQRMLPRRSGSTAGAAGSCKLILPPKGKKPARKKERKLLPLPLSELVKTKSLNLLFAAWLHGAFGAASSLGKKEGCHQDCINLCVSEREM